MKPYKFFSVTSLSHSGSTAFSIALASHPDLISLGEVFQVLRHAPEYWLHDANHTCSCGKPTAQCGFWGPALEQIRANVPMPAKGEEKYSHVSLAYKELLSYFHKVYGDEKRMVDTSKGIRHLNLIASDPLLSPTICFLLRDVRSYASSQTRLARSEQRSGLKKIKGHYWFPMLKWYQGNRKREKLLNRSELNVVKIGYEQFCFNVESVLGQVYHSAGLPLLSSTGNLEQAEHHILFGNPMRLSAKKSSEIAYDARWLKENDYLLPACLMPFVMKYNRQAVYQTSAAPPFTGHPVQREQLL